MNATDLERIRWLCDPLASTAEAEEFAALAMEYEEGDEEGEEDKDGRREVTASTTPTRSPRGSADCDC